MHVCSVFVEIFNDQLCSIWTTLSVYAQIGLFFVCWECVSPQLVLTIIKSDQFHVFISISKQRVSVCGLCVCVHLDLIREGSQKYTLCDKYLVELLNSDKNVCFVLKHYSRLVLGSELSDSRWMYKIWWLSLKTIVNTIRLWSEKKNGKKCVTKSVENIWGVEASSWKLFEYIEWTTVTTYCLCDREFKSASTMLYPFLNLKKFKH